MSRENCKFENENCKYYNSSTGCFADYHHYYWPKDNYTTPTEKRFRSSFVTLECRAVHDELHAVKPPEKPTHEQMCLMLGRLAREGSSGTSET